MKINKINQLKNKESFLQVNFVKGFEYIDKAGKILNLFNKKPQYINLDALLIDKTEKEKIRITPFSFWSHFVLPDSLDQISNNFIKDAENILEIIGVNEITRIGWRNYFIYEFNNDKEIKNILNKFIQKENLDFNAVAFSYKKDEINFNFRIEKFLDASDEKDKKIKLLIDVDSFKDFSNDKLLKLNDGERILREIREKIQSESFLNIINFILSEKNVSN